MTNHEIEVCRKIKRLGYTLKYFNKRYFIKGYSGGLSFNNLEQVENWIIQINEKMKKEREKYKSEMRLLNDKVVFPIYKEDYKKVFFECIKENEYIIEKNKQELVNIFNENSELYDGSYLVYRILSDINYNKYYRDNDLESNVWVDMESFYFSEIKRLNPEIDEELIFDLPDYDFVGFYFDIMENIKIEELKDYIMELANADCD